MICLLTSPLVSLSPWDGHGWLKCSCPEGQPVKVTVFVRVAGHFLWCWREDPVLHPYGSSWGLSAHVLLEQTWHDRTWCFAAPDQWACLIRVTCLMITVHDPSDIRKTLVNPQTASVRSSCLVEVKHDPWHVPAEDDEGI